MYRCSIRYDDHPDYGWPIIRLACQDPRNTAHQTVAQIAPTQGCNLFDWAVDGIEYICEQGTVKSSQRQLLGTPVLYPTPNRVRNAQFTFDGHTYSFEPNNGANATEHQNMLPVTPAQIKHHDPKSKNGNGGADIWLKENQSRNSSKDDQQ